MKRNIFKVFFDKILAYPLWVKQVILYGLYRELEENCNSEELFTTPQKLFSLETPTITFAGQTELRERKCGFDNNIYNFLKYSHDGYNIAQTTLNMFMSIEETSKLYVFCVEQNFIEKPVEKEILPMAEFLAGKIYTGEFFHKSGMISEEQLQKALEEQKNFSAEDKKILLGQVLVELGFVKVSSVKKLFGIKDDAKKRFVLNSETFPELVDKKLADDGVKAELERLKQENKALKKTMQTIINTVKQNDF